MIELSKSNNLRRADMSYENAPVELTHGHYYTCGGLPAGSRGRFETNAESCCGFV